MSLFHNYGVFYVQQWRYTLKEIKVKIPVTIKLLEQNNSVIALY